MAEEYEIMMHNPGLDSEVYINVPGSLWNVDRQAEETGFERWCPAPLQFQH